MPLIEAMQIHAPIAGMRFRLIETFHAANAAKQVLCGSRSEAVRRKLVSALQECKIPVRDKKMQVPGPAADRAIAIEHFRRAFDLAFEPHRAAVTTT